MHLTDIIIEELIPQRSPMLMIDKIIALENSKINVHPLYLLDQAPLWKLIESMGQAAQLLWSLQGVQGDYYLVKIDKFVKEAIIPDSHIYIEAEKGFCTERLYKTHVKLFTDNLVCASAEMTHYLNERR